jgi:hypothetical protein
LKENDLKGLVRCLIERVLVDVVKELGENGDIRIKQPPPPATSATTNTPLLPTMNANKLQLWQRHRLIRILP